MMEKHIAWSTLAITKAVDEGDERVLTGVATSPTPDRAGDIVEPKGAQFKLPIPFLSQHSSGLPIGHVTAATVTAKGITVTIKIAKDTGLDYVETAWKQIKSGLVRGLSIGFRPDFKNAEPIDPKFPWDGWRFKIWEWLELSAVTIPANADCGINSIKAFGMQAAAGSGTDAAKSGRSASSIPHSLTKGNTMPTIQDRIDAAEAARILILDQITEKTAALDEDDSDEAQDALTALNGELARKDKLIDTLKATEIALKGRISTADDEPDAGERARKGGAPFINRKGIQKSEEPGFAIFRHASIMAIARAEQKSFDQVLAERYGHDANTVEMHKSGVFNMLQKTASAPATTTGSTWAANLVDTQLAEFVDLLQPINVFGQMSANAGQSMMFDGAGTLKFPRRNSASQAAGDLRGAFVGEGDPIPVRIGSIGSVSFTQKKMGVITFYTREILAQSSPSIEAISRRMILDDTALAIDTAFLDAVASSAIRPAGILNGVTPGTSATGTDLDDMIADLSTLLANFGPVAGGRRLAVVMRSQAALALSMKQNALGAFAFPNMTQSGGEWHGGIKVYVSDLLATGVVAMVDTQSLITLYGGPEFLSSEHATLHAEDGTYQSNQTAAQPTATVEHIGTAGTPNVVSAPVYSMFQTASVALRMLLPMNWGFIRAGAVASIDSVDWSS